MDLLRPFGKEKNHKKRGMSNIMKQKSKNENNLYVSEETTLEMVKTITMVRDMTDIDKRIGGVNLLIEGCDGVGKSAVIKELLLTGHFYASIKDSSPPKNKGQGKWRYKMELKLMNKCRGFIYDRTLLSERVYAPLLRNYYPDYMGKLERKIKRHNYLILMFAKPEIVIQRYDGKVLTPEQILYVLKQYLIEYKKSKYPNKILIDSSEMTPFELSKLIIRLVELE